MSKALKRKQNPKTVAVNNINDNFEKVVKKATQEYNVSEGPSSIRWNSDDEEIEVIPKKRFQNNAKKETKVISMFYMYISCNWIIELLTIFEFSLYRNRSFSQRSRKNDEKTQRTRSKF
jgi:hypothetical protein